MSTTRQQKKVAADLQIQRADRIKFDQARTTLDGYYSEKETEWRGYEAEERARDVKGIMVGKNVVFCHGLISEHAPEGNTLVRSDISWKDKLNIVMAFAPTVSTSIVNPEHQGLWSNVGILINGGRAESANPQDAATVAKSLSKRMAHGGTPSSIEEQLEQTLARKTNDRTDYNEVVVSEPVAVGVFIQVDTSKVGFEAPLQEVVTESQRIGLPVFAIKGGEIYELTGVQEVWSYGQFDGNRPVLGRKLEPAELAALPDPLTQDRRESLSREILEDSPFLSKDLGLVDERIAGQITYVALNMNELEINEPRQRSPYQALGDVRPRDRLLGIYLPGGYRDESLDGKEAILLGEVKSPSAISQLVKVEGQLLVSSTGKKTGRKFVEHVQTENLREWPSGGERNMGVLRAGEDRSPINTTVSYLESMKRTIEQIETIRATRKKSHPDQEVVIGDESLKKIAFHLYGFAEEAGRRSDANTQEQAAALASRLMSIDEYNAFVQRRIGPNGEFRMSKEELAGS